MIKNIFFTFSVIFISIFFTGCVKLFNDELTHSSYSNHITTKLKIPKVCKKEYEFTLPRVAVLDFVNNSTYKNAKINNKHSSAAIGVGVSVVGIGAGIKNEKYSTKRTIEAKLSESTTPLIESIILETGGAELYTRTKLDVINTELKLQDSGLLDPNSVVKFGQLSGVQYLITGSIDNVTADYRGYMKYANNVRNVAQNTRNKEFQITSSLLSLGALFFDGTDIHTQITIKIIDVSTGKIMFTKTLNEDIKVSNKKIPTYDHIISGIKNSIIKTMPRLQKEFKKYFLIQGYITKLRTKDDDIIAQINLGKKHKIQQNDTFNIFTLEENIDPLTGDKSCDKIQLEGTLTASKQISQTHTWLNVKDTNINALKILQIVQRQNR